MQGIKVKAFSLMNEKMTELLGYRFQFFYQDTDSDMFSILSITPDIGVLTVDADKADAKIILGICEKKGYAVDYIKRVILMHIKGDRYVSDNERYVTDYSSIEDFKRLLKEFEKKVEKALKKAKLLDDNKLSLVNDMKYYLRKEEIPYSTQDVQKSAFGLEIRFLGGYRAWSGPEEDICDADVLSPDVVKRVNRAVGNFNKNSKQFKVSFTTGEKAWSYFMFEPKG